MVSEQTEEALAFQLKHYIKSFSDTYWAMAFFTASFIWLRWDIGQALSFAAGCGVMFLVFYSTAWLLELIFKKRKSHKLLGFFLFKYPLLAVLLAFIYRSGWMAPVAFTSGFLLVPLAFLGHQIRQVLRR